MALALPSNTVSPQGTEGNTYQHPDKSTDRGFVMTGKEISIIHPRPSSIVAALYTLRDLKVDVAILHGPPGCSFKHARLLEEDGIHVVTTALDENGFVFGGHDRLVQLINKSVELFSPKIIGVVGTCASMIIGEEMHEAVLEANPDVPVIEVEVHAGYHNNTKGVIFALESALDAGIIDRKEFERQEYLLAKATEVEKNFGAASREYLAPSRGDVKYIVAKRVLELLKEGKRGITIMNAKKETGYMFADITLAVNEVAASLGKKDSIVNMANLDETVGLPRVRQHAEYIMRDLKAHGVEVHELIGGMDEYPIAGEKVSELIKEKYSDYDFAIITGVPHAIPMDNLKGMELISVTNGPRQVLPMKEMGHDYVMVEIDLHPKTLGVSSIVESEFGATLREVAKEA
jgi:putative methanogenesis marker 13 metalloprotein